MTETRISTTCEDLMPEFRISRPVMSGYKDINSDMQMVPIDRQKVSEYLERV
ncbi:hypothetical protein DPMN_049480 [Dreissena polymorpha]|uniref:Uncharacterized protein n=1 Tax=Dreissena polymorpha TaxID=45954 RepID=A0A9D4HM60_DREPO|nr:hypothetical protein DPMN_049480 [Dreissena polymorpha]